MIEISDLRRILVVGAGTIGQEIAVQCALHGFEVVLHDIDPEQLRAAPARQRSLLEQIAQNRSLPVAEMAASMARIHLTDRPEEAARDVDLLSESVSERLPVKREVLAQFGRLCPPRTIFTTNSSYYLPSSLAASSGRSERFAALHFHAPVWFANAVDIMPHAGTDPQLVPVLVEFARRIGQVPIVAKKESPGYVFNAMLNPILFTALALAAAEVATAEDVDRAWMVVTKMALGPFGMIDTIGLSTVHELVSKWGPLMRTPHTQAIVSLLKGRIDLGLLGQESGEGFYRYPQPAYAAAEFVAATPQPTTGAPLGARTKQRFVLTTEPAPLNPSVRLQPGPGRRCLLLGGEAIAANLAERLLAAGAAVVWIGVSEDPDKDRDRALAAVDAAPPTDLFVLTGADQQTPSSWDWERAGQRFRCGVQMPYFIVQRWFQSRAAARLLDRSTFVAVTRLGGDFGLSGQIEAAEGSGFAGLAKAMFLEAALDNSLGLGIKVVDLPADVRPEQAADWIMREWLIAQHRLVTGSLAELRRHHADAEIGYWNQQRHVIRLVPSPLDSRSGAEPPIHRGGGWIVTGGGRGITAQLAEALGQRYGVRLHLLGRTSLPAEDYLAWSEEDLQRHKAEVMRKAYQHKEKPNVAWERIARQIELQRTLHRLQQAGVPTHYHQADVTDRAALAAALEQARRCGPLEGILHGAGVEHTARFDRKSEGDFRATVAVKSLAAVMLAELTMPDPLQYWIGLGSLAGRFGGIGQTDYALANDLLAKTVAWIGSRRPGVRCFTLHWPGWEDLGMAARSASRDALERAGQRLMPVREGIEHFLAELTVTSPAAEVLFVGDEELPWELRSSPRRTEKHDGSK